MNRIGFKMAEAHASVGGYFLLTVPGLLRPLHLVRSVELP